MPYLAQHTIDVLEDCIIYMDNTFYKVRRSLNAMDGDAVCEEIRDFAEVVMAHIERIPADALTATLTPTVVRHLHKVFPSTHFSDQDYRAILRLAGMYHKKWLNVLTVPPSYVQQTHVVEEPVVMEQRSYVDLTMDIDGEDNQ